MTANDNAMQEETHDFTEPPDAPEQLTVRIDDVFAARFVAPSTMDELWAAGWRHQGIVFYRYSETDMGGEHHHITPLRIDLSRFTLSKSQQRVLRRNADVCIDFVPAAFDDEIHRMFARHRERFIENVPESLSNFFSDTPGTCPCPCLAQRVSVAGQLIAVSFMDVGLLGASSVYAIFDPDFSHRSLGTFTMLKEIEHAQQQGIRWLYHGYATLLPSHYDYKKLFRAVEWLDWETGAWTPQRAPSPTP